MPLLISVKVSSVKGFSIAGASIVAIASMIGVATVSMLLDSFSVALLPSLSEVALG